jgi:hypothetical protein
VYFGFNDEIDEHDRLDIDGDKDIIMFNKHEVDNNSRRNIASYLRNRISEQMYRFNRGVHIRPEETFKIDIIGEDIDYSKIDSLYIGDLEFKRKRFKSRYDNVHVFFEIKNGEYSYFLKEGDRYLSPEESCHLVDLVDGCGDITFCIDKDTWIKIKMQKDA